MRRGGRARIAASGAMGPSGSDVLLGEGAAAPGNIWAVGDSNATHLHHTLILHWNGSSWVQS